jgi:hypothetical protein
MGKMYTWEEIKVEFPELADRLKKGDIEARIEFARLSFGGEYIEK